MTGKIDLSRFSGEMRRDAERLLAHCLGIGRAEWLARPQSEVPPDVREVFAQLLQRLQAGEPLAYLTGEKEFWSLPLRIDASVLVPRPETELLVESVLAVGRALEPLAVLDLGTGSGAIALALARERPNWGITAVDISLASLTVARRNAVRLGLDRIEFLAGDWYQPIVRRRFDLIVSNPPYIAEDDPALREPALGFEPRGALVAGRSGLEALQAIIRDAPRHLHNGGQLLLEHGFSQGGDARRLLTGAGFSNIRTRNDLAGRERVTAGDQLCKELTPP